jgi:hypothetical protein
MKEKIAERIRKIDDQMADLRREREILVAYDLNAMRREILEEEAKREGGR